MTNPEDKHTEELYRLFKDSVFELSKTLPLISALAVGLLVIPGNLVPFELPAKLLISCLLLIMPASMHIFILEMDNTATSAKEGLEKKLGKSLGGGNWFGILRARFLEFCIFIFWIFALVSIYYAWSS